MDSVFQNFKDVIARAQEGGFPELAKLVLRGKIDYAVERGVSDAAPGAVSGRGAGE